MTQPKHLMQMERQEQPESVGCLLVLNSVTTTPRWICQPEPRDVHDVCVFVCKCVLGSPGASLPLIIFAYAFFCTQVQLSHFASSHARPLGLKRNIQTREPISGRSTHARKHTRTHTHCYTHTLQRKAA